MSATTEDLPASVRAAVGTRAAAHAAGFADGGETGPHELALREAHNEAVHAPPTVFDLGGRTFVLAKPTTGDLIGLRKHLLRAAQAEMEPAIPATLNALRAMREAAGPDKPAYDDGDYKALLEIAVATQAKAAADPALKGKPEPTARQVDEFVGTVAGVRAYVWYRLRLTHPDVTREWVAEHVTAANMLAVLKDLAADTGMSAVDPN